MIELSSCLVVLSHQGGCYMYPLSSSRQDQSPLAHVWSHLSSDLQTCIVGLLAELALNALVARPQNWPQREEACDVEQATHAQNPS